MAFDDHLKRAFDTLIAELAETARTEREQAAAESRTKGLEEGRTQGRTDGHARGLQEGRATGLEEGRTKGHDEGHAKGLEDGRVKGFEAGRAKGFEEGRTQGVEEGRSQGWEDGREQGRFEGRQEAEAEHVQAAFAAPVAPPADVPVAVPERVLDGVRAIDRARTLSEVLDTLASSCAREASRAAVLLVRGSNLRGWRFIGFDRALADGPAVDVAMSDAGVIADAVTKREPAASDALPSFARPGTGGLAIPIEIAGEVVAALYADGNPTRASIELLTRHAARALEAVVALQAARMLNAPALAENDATADNRSGAADHGNDDNDADTAALRFARLLVSEIKLYHEPAVTAGRRDRDLATRLGGEIARARVMYEQRVPPTVRGRTNYFHDELVRTLANGDATLLERT